MTEATAAWNLQSSATSSTQAESASLAMPPIQRAGLLSTGASIRTMRATSAARCSSVTLAKPTHFWCARPTHLLESQAFLCIAFARKGFVFVFVVAAELSAATLARLAHVWRACPTHLLESQAFPRIAVARKGFVFVVTAIATELSAVALARLAHVWRACPAHLLETQAFLRIAFARKGFVFVFTAIATELSAVALAYLTRFWSASPTHTSEHLTLLAQSSACARTMFLTVFTRFVADAVTMLLDHFITRASELLSELCVNFSFGLHERRACLRSNCMLLRGVLASTTLALLRAANWYDMHLALRAKCFARRPSAKARTLLPIQAVRAAVTSAVDDV